MQNLSSKTNEHLQNVSDLFDGRCHQQSSGMTELLSSDEVKSHLKNWALIRSSLRNELPEKIDLNFSDKVMAAIAKEDMEKAWVPPYDDTADLPSSLRVSFNSAADRSGAQDSAEGAAAASTRPLLRMLNLKKAGIFASQIAIAATVASVAVIGLQTYNASSPVMESVASTAATNVGPVVGLSLASYQNSDNEMMINLDAVQENGEMIAPGYQADLKQKQKEELDKINVYVRGYVLDTASNK